MTSWVPPFIMGRSDGIISISEKQWMQATIRASLNDFNTKFTLSRTILYTKCTLSQIKILSVNNIMSEYYSIFIVYWGESNCKLENIYTIHAFCFKDIKDMFAFTAQNCNY